MNIYICLVDEKLELPKYKRIGEDIEQNAFAYFADGKRYKDICHTMLLANVNRMTICRIFKKYVVVMQNISKIKLEPNQPIYISIDDGHRKFWNFLQTVLLLIKSSIFYFYMQVHMLATILNNCVMVHYFMSLTRVDNSDKDGYKICKFYNYKKKTRLFLVFLWILL